MSPLVPHTLRQAVDQAESGLFTGRRQELSLLRQSASAARRGGATAVYVHGPAGVGKSALVRAHVRWVRSQGTVAVLLEPSAPLARRDALLSALAAQVGGGGVPEEDVIVDQIHRLAAPYGLVLAVDPYEPLLPEDEWLRQHLFLRLGAGVSLVLVGRRPPHQVWPGQEVWSRVLRSIPLQGLDSAAAGRLLSRLGIRPERAAEVIAATGGHPGGLVLAAQAIRSAEEAGATATGPGPHAVTSLLAEHLLHPGSSQTAWRPAVDRTLDPLLAAAAFLPGVDRPALEALVGRRVMDAEWSALVNLPLFVDTPWGHRIPHPARHALMSIVAAAKPWLARWSLLRAARHYREAASDTTRGATTWPLSWFAVAPLAADAFQRGAPTPTAGTPEAEWWEPLRRAAPVRPGGSTGAVPSGRAVPPQVMVGSTGAGEVVLRWTTGGCQACPLYRPLGRNAEAALGDDALRPCIEALAPGKRPVLTGACVAGSCCWAGRLRAMLCAHLRLGRAPTPRMVWMPSDVQLADRLGFIPAPEFHGGPGERPVFVLDFTTLEETTWLDGVLSVAERASPPVQERAALLAEALSALDHPARLGASGAAKWAHLTLGTSRPADVRQWIVDAAAETRAQDADAVAFLTREFPGLSGTPSHHAVGTHEPSAPAPAALRTYYRHRRHALLAVADVLFA